MTNKLTCYLFLSVLAAMLCSCASTNISNYYSKNKLILDSIEQSYKQQYNKHHFSILFTDRLFENISLEIVTDSIRYIYDFGITANRIKDTLEKYHFTVPEMQSLISSMQSVRCAWIDNQDYYVDDKKNSLVYMSIKKRGIKFPFVQQKYYILTYFAQPQYYDSEGRLLDHRSRRRLRKINGEIFKRVNDKVCYTVSSIFR